MDREKGSSRSRRIPHEEGPRVFRRGRYWNADLRPWGGTRTTLRDPKHPRWPDHGERTEDKEAALRWVWDYVDELQDRRKRKQLGRPPKGRTLAQAKEEYLRHRAQHKAPTTVQKGTAVFTHLVEHLGGMGMRTTDITPEILQDLIDRRLEAGYEASTVRTLCSQLSAFFKWLGGPNPMREVQWPKRKKADARPWTDEELTILRDGADKVGRQMGRDIARRAIELGIATGARQRELFALEWADLRPRTSTVRIVRQLTPQGAPRLPKGDETRTALVLDGWWPWHSNTAVGPVLYNTKGSVLSESSQRGLIRDVLRTAGLYEMQLGWHTLRHTYARLFIERGGTLHDLQKNLGHNDIATTQEYYDHLTDETAAARARRAIYGEDWRPPLAVE